MNARKAALITLESIERKSTYANLAVAHMLRTKAIDEVDRTLFVELVYGVVKARGTLDWMVAQYAKKTGNIHPIVRLILHIGLYQLFFLERIPHSAACNESVELAKKHVNPGAAKFVNAILRTALREPERIVFPNLDSDPVRHITLKYYHPEWLVRLWLNQFGCERTIELCQFDNTPSDLSVRINTLKSDYRTIAELLTEHNVTYSVSKIASRGLLISKHGHLDDFQLLRDGLLIVQDESAQMPAEVLAPEPGETIIDCCAAPGGKTTQLAALMNNCGKIIAMDIHEHKLKLINDNATRCGANIIESLLCDARLAGAKFGNVADKVLVDVPCSGLGVLRKKVDARWKKTPTEIAQLPKLQYDILCGAAASAREGGEIVYSTCTTNSDENEAVVRAFINNNPGYSLLNAGSRVSFGDKKSEFINIYPFVEHTDGFFIALIKKSAC